MGSLSRPQQIATGPNDSIYALAGPKQGANYAIYKWQNNTWAMLPRYASSISVSSSGDLFITDVGKIYSTSGNITEAQLSTKDEYLKCNIDEILTDQKALTEQIAAATSNIDTLKNIKLRCYNLS